MGDVLTLVEKAEAAIKEEDAERMREKMLKNKFDYDDFLEQFKMIANMGPMGQVMKMMPGMSKITDKQMMAAEKKFMVRAYPLPPAWPAGNSPPISLLIVPSGRTSVTALKGPCPTAAAPLTALPVPARVAGVREDDQRDGGGRAHQPRPHRQVAQPAATHRAGVGDEGGSGAGPHLHLCRPQVGQSPPPPSPLLLLPSSRMCTSTQGKGGRR